MIISQLCKSLLFTTSCTLFFVPVAATQAQSLSSIDYLYVSPQGNDSWSGQLPVPADGTGPFQTIAHAQEAVSALAKPSLSRPVEITLDPAVCSPQESLSRWFSAAPTTPVIWHSEPGRTVLIYTPTMAEQIDALSAEDYLPAGAQRTLRLYVSRDGSDQWTGQAPSEDAGNGPFRTLEHAQEAVNALQAETTAPIEVVFEASASGSIAASSAKKTAAKKPHAEPKYTPAGLAALKALSTPQASGAAKKTVFRNPVPVAGVSSNLAAGTAAGGVVSPHLVFAHYMVCNRDYGGSVPGYEKEIQEAQAAGIDGFALNCGSWNGGMYKIDVAALFEAAEALNTGFKLFFSADMTGLHCEDVTVMMKAYANRPNYWHVSQVTSTGTVSRAVLSTWGGEGGGYTAAKGWWQNLTLTPLKSAGIDTYFMPFFFTTSPDGKQYLDGTAANTAVEISGLLKGLADGSFYSPSIGCPTSPDRGMLNNAESQAAQLKAAGLGTMGSVTPQYWGSKQISAGRRYVEYEGGAGLTAQWNSIINVQKPDWVELFTWNDWDEASYFSPMDDVNKYWPYTAHTAPGFYKTHAGMLKLNQYFVNWYKSGVKPAVTADSLYYAYRTNPKDAVATNDTVGPVTWRIGDIQDSIYVTTLLTAPATLVVTTGSKTLTYPVSAGLSNTSVPFQVGAQSFKIVRNGQTVLSQAGTPIAAVPTEYNFNYFSGWAGQQSAGQTKTP